MKRNRNYGAFYALLKDLPHADKEELVLSWTGGRTSSLREMTDGEYERMIQGLRAEIQDRDALRRARSSVLKLLQQYGIDTTSFDKVNAFCQQARVAGKPFGALKVGELEALSRKMRSILSKSKAKEREVKQTLRERYGGNITILLPMDKIAEA